MSKLSRRAFLKKLGVGAAAAGAASTIPFYPILSAAQEGAFPTRVIIFFSANGTVHENWAPTGGETDFVLSPILQPLAPFRDKLLIVDEMRMESAFNGPGDDHQRGMGHVLTGTELLSGSEFPGCGGNCPGSGWGGGISVDQAIANAVGGDNAFPSLELGVQVRSNNVWSRMVYKGANEPVPAEDDPWAAADRIFGGLGADPTGAAKVRREQQTVLDALNADYGRIKNKVGQSDKAKIEAHLDGLRELQRRLDLDENALGQYCTVPELPGSVDIQANENFPLIGQLQMDLMVMAMACDLTRVGTIQWSRAVSNVKMDWIGVSEGHHELSHEGDGNGSALDKLTTINTWYAEQFGYLMNSLSQIPEGDGTMLDHTAVVWVNELARGNRHSHDPQPVVIGGGGGGYLRPGRYIKTGGASHNDMLTSLCHLMGVTEIEKFGNPAYCNGPLVSLT